MSDKPISDLCRRMLEDMSVRKFGEKTQSDYIRHVARLAKFLGRSPDTATQLSPASHKIAELLAKHHIQHQRLKSEGFTRIKPKDIVNWHYEIRKRPKRDVETLYNQVLETSRKVLEGFAAEGRARFVPTAVESMIQSLVMYRHAEKPPS